MHKKVLASLAILLTLSVTSQAVVYNVNRSFQTSTLAGTVSIPTGSYVIQNASPSPFTDVDLSLTVNSTSHHLAYAVTDAIHGGSQFFIEATPTALTFSVANASGFNPADLVFADTNASAGNNNRYAIGSDVSPFESVNTEIGEFAFHGVTLPIVFATAVPEPSTLLLLGIGAISLLGYRKAKSHC